MTLDADGYPIYVGEFTADLLGPPAPTLTNGGNFFFTDMAVKVIVPLGPSLLPLQLKSISMKDKSPLYGNQRALAGSGHTGKNATYAKMHKDMCVLCVCMLGLNGCESFFGNV